MTTTPQNVLGLTLAATEVAASVAPSIRRGLANRPRGRRVLVDPSALDDLVRAVEVMAPGVLADIDAQAARRRAERRAER